MTKPNTYDRIEMPASLRSEHFSPSARNAVRVPFGISVHLRRNPHPSEEAAFKLLYLALAKVVAKWETVQQWKQMLNYLEMVCGDRIREAGVRQ